MLKGRDLLIDNKHIYNFEMNFIFIFKIFTRIILFLFLIGFFHKKPFLFLKINFVVKTILGIFLMYRFNNYRRYKIKFTELDRRVCFSAGLYIVIVSLGEHLFFVLDKIRSQVIKYTYPYVKHIKEIFPNNNKEYELTS